MTRRGSIRAFALAAVAVFLAEGTALAYSSLSDVSIQRNLSATSAHPGDVVTVTVTVTVGAIGADPLRGLCVADHVPAGLLPTQGSVTLDAASVTVVRESTRVRAVYPRCTTERWAFELPPTWAEDHPVPADSTVVVTYDVTIPSDATEGDLTFPACSWFGMLPAAGDAGDHFGYLDSDDVMTVSSSLAHWKLDETAPGSVVDSQGSNHGTNQGATIDQPGWIDTAYGFNGTNSYLDMAGAASLDLTAAITLSAWIRSDASSDTQFVISKLSDAARQYELRLHPDGSVAAAFYETNAVSSEANSALGTGGSWDDGRWHHVAATIDALDDGKARLYIDGKLSAVAGTAVTGVQSTAVGVLVGAKTGDATSYFNGNIDDVRIYDRALDAAGIAILAGDLSGPVAHWELDDGAGAVADDSAGGNHGALMPDFAGGNAPTWAPGHVGTNALDFDGTDDYVVATGYTGIAGAGARTVAAWVETTDTDGPIVVWGEQVSGRKFTFRMSGSNIRAEVENGGVTGSTVVGDGAWHHVAVTWSDDGTPNVLDAELYVDGAVETFSASAGEPVNTSGANDVRIGSDVGIQGTARYFAGRMDDVHVYDRALSAEEVYAHYDGTMPLPRPNTPPTVSITLPLDGAAFAEAADITIEADAVDPGGTVTGVEFVSYGPLSISSLGSGTDMGSDTWSVDWTGVPAGAYALTAEATDDGGAVTGSAQVWIRIGSVLTIAATQQAAEPSTNGVFTVTRSGYTGAAVDVGFALGAATTATEGAGADFTLTPASPLSFAAGETQKTITVEVRDDSLMEGDELVMMDLEPGVGYGLGLPSTATVTIADGPPPPLATHWRLDELGGLTAVNAVAPGFFDGDLTNMTGAEWTSGQVGGALAFDGVEDYVDIDGGFMMAGWSEFTLTAWVNASTIRNNAGHGMGTDYGNAIIEGRAGKDAIAFQLGNTDEVYGYFRVDDATDYSVVTTTSPVSTGAWYHVALCYTGTKLQIYVGGQFVTEADASGNVKDGTGGLWIGQYANNGTNCFDGNLDDVRIYSVALTQPEILALYNEGLNPPPTIMAHPVGQTVTEGETATFTVAAVGPGTLTYQWRKDGVDITGATAPSYTTLPTTMADDGAQFTCVVTNANGSTTSSGATLTVNGAPAPPPPAGSGGGCASGGTGSAAGLFLAAAAVLLCYIRSPREGLCRRIRARRARGARASP